MGMAYTNADDWRTATDADSTNRAFREHHYRPYIVYNYSNFDSTDYGHKPWVNQIKYVDNDERRPIDPMPWAEHLKLSRKRDFVYSRRTAPNWKPRTAIINRSNPRWSAKRWKAKT